MWPLLAAKERRDRKDVCFLCVLCVLLRLRSYSICSSDFVPVRGRWLRDSRLGFLRNARWLIGPSRRTDVKAARADQPVVVVLLDDVGAPAGDPGTGEDGRVQLWRDTQQMKHR